METILEQLFRTIQEICPAERGVSMQKHTTFKIGGQADILAMPDSEAALCALLTVCKEVPHLIIGNGSNLLVGDGGIRGVVIKIGNRMGAISVKGEEIHVAAGATLAATAAAALEAGLGGMAFAAGIPGTVGGAILMNAGAYGGEMADIVTEVSYIDTAGKLCRTRDAGFSYRHSKFQENDAVITGATLQLHHADRETVRNEMEVLAEKRRTKQPLTKPSAGSAFKRPVGGYAAQMIDEAGLRGKRIGDAAVSEKHAGFIVNLGGATAAEVRQLMSLVQETVQKTHGIWLEPEIRFVGEFT